MDITTKELCVSFHTSSGPIHAVDHANLCFRTGKITGIIGETGSGKSVLGLSILGLLQSNATVSGQISLGDRLLTSMTETELCGIRGKEIALVAQNPATSLNPSQTVTAQIEEVFRLQGFARQQARAHSLALLEQMQFQDPAKIAKAYPFMLSGGMRQRVLTAIAVAAKPHWILADEPTKGLDAILRSQIYETFVDIHNAHNINFIVITHDLVLARKLCDHIIVMYCGKVLEENETDALFSNPKHPYTRGLIASLPHMGMIPMAGFSPAFTQLPQGCVFSPRCAMSQAKCFQAPPSFNTHCNGGVSCYYA